MEKDELKPEAHSSSETQWIIETMKPSGPGKATCKFAIQKPKNSKYGVSPDDFIVDERDRSSEKPYQAKYSDGQGKTVQTPGASFLFRLPLTFAFPNTAVRPGDSWSDISGSSVLNFQFKVRGIRCTYKGQCLVDGVPCCHLELSESLGDPRDITSSNMLSGHSTGNGQMEGQIYVRAADGDIQRETVKQHTVMDRLDVRNRMVVDQTLDIYRLGKG